MPRKPQTPPEQSTAFDPSEYDDPRLRLDPVDGKDVDEISIRFAGTITLNRKSPEAVELYKRFVLGHKVDLGSFEPLYGMVVGRNDRQVLDANGYVANVGQTVVVRVTDLGGFGKPATPASSSSDDDDDDDDE
jgi:hypothetical protein